MPRPVNIAIPAIDVSARIVPLGLNPDHTLEVPANLADTGWFTEGPEPGERGATVVVGHVASLSGPGVFYRLRDLHPGDVIRIRLRDGEVVSYRARSVIVVPKISFPTKRVYAQTPRPTLRLITCSGTLDASTGQHPDNRIVLASFLGVT
jgi:sortase (surface protein transpeptidase)